MNIAPSEKQYSVHTLERQNKCVFKIKLHTFSFLMLITSSPLLTNSHTNFCLEMEAQWQM